MTEHVGDRLRLMGMFADLVPPTVSVSPGGSYDLYLFPNGDSERLVRIVHSWETTIHDHTGSEVANHWVVRYKVKNSTVRIIIMIPVEQATTDVRQVISEYTASH